MKKILALILAFGCIFAFASCGILGLGTDQTPTEKETVANIQKAIDESAPVSASITVKFESLIGELNGSYDVSYNNDGSATVDYSYERFNEFTLDSVQDEFKSVVSGNVTVSADGVLSEEIGGVASVEAVTFDIELKEEYFTSVSVANSVLRGTIKSENTFDALGVDIMYDVDLVVFTGNGRVTSIVISYESENGPIEISAMYRY